MNVQVIGDAGAAQRRDSSHVEPAVNKPHATQFATLRHVHHLIRDLFRRRIKLARVQVRNDHQMPLM
jgi:hypothetical protein